MITKLKKEDFTAHDDYLLNVVLQTRELLFKTNEIIDWINSQEEKPTGYVTIPMEEWKEHQNTKERCALCGSPFQNHHPL